MKYRLLPILAVFAWVFAQPAFAVETALAQPKPTPDNPRKIMLQLTSDDPRAINDLLYNVVNIQKFYGQDNVRVAVIAFSAGNRALYKSTSPVRERISSLVQYDVEFLACGNTMEATDRQNEALIEGVEVVTAGIPEIVERQLQGWIYIRP
ncbi:MAG: DsrE family protein [Rhodospirillales bacterium]|nr:DsrE family protein [Rhodospirillales bacterium]